MTRLVLKHLVRPNKRLILDFVLLAGGFFLSFLLLHLHCGETGITTIVGLWWRDWADAGAYSIALFALVGPTLMGLVIVVLHMSKSFGNECIIEGRIWWLICGIAVLPVAMKMVLHRMIMEVLDARIHRCMIASMEILDKILVPSQLYGPLFGMIVCACILWRRAASELPVFASWIDIAGVLIGIAWMWTSLRLYYIWNYRPELCWP